MPKTIKKDNQSETTKKSSAKKNVKRKSTKKPSKKQSSVKQTKTDPKYRKRIYASTTLNDFVGSGTDLNQLLKLIQKDAEKRLGTDATLAAYLDRLTQFQIDDRNIIKKEAEDELITLLGKLNGMHLLNAEIPTGSPAQSVKSPSKKNNDFAHDAEKASTDVPNVDHDVNGSNVTEVQNQESSDTDAQAQTLSESTAPSIEDNNEDPAPMVSAPDATVTPLEPVPESVAPSEEKPAESVEDSSNENAEGPLDQSTDSTYEEVQINDLEDGGKALSSFFNADQANG